MENSWRRRVSWRFLRQGAVLLLAAVAQAAVAHPAPFSYLDLQLADSGASGTLVIHDFDAAHELGLAEPQALLAPSVASAREGELTRLIGTRLTVRLDAELATLRWRPVEVLPEQQSLRFGFTIERAGTPGHVEIDAALFPYDANHQTFINVYEAGRLERQAILNAIDRRFEHYSGTTQGRMAVVRSFVALGLKHILVGPDHLLFLLGLLLLGGSLWRLATIVTAFTLGHSVTLSLAALGLVRVAPTLVEPAIALSIVVVGVDNLLVARRGTGPTRGDGHDLRPWFAAAFGLVHGLGFAAVLRETGLPPGALGWSLAAFNVGAELGQLAVVIPAAGLLVAIRRYDVPWAERFARGGSIVVIAAGLYWFGQRVGFWG